MYKYYINLLFNIWLQPTIMTSFIKRVYENAVFGKSDSFLKTIWFLITKGTRCTNLIKQLPMIFQ